MQQKTLSKSLVLLTSIAFFSTATFASVYFKGYGGNTLNSVDYQHNILGFDPALSGRQEFRELNTDNLATVGGALGVVFKQSRLFGYGVELDVRRQLDKTKFKMMEISAESGLTDTGLISLNIENQYKAVLSAVFTLSNSFYFKIGPSVLNQDIHFKLTESDPPNVSAKSKDSKTLLGATLGAGYTYNVTNNFGIFTEYNYSYYKSKKLSDFNATEANFPSIAAGEVYSHTDRKVKYGQSEFFVGFVVSSNLIS